MWLKVLVSPGIEAPVWVLLTCAATVDPLRLLGGGCAHGGVLLDPRSSCAKHGPAMGGQRAPVVDVNLAKALPASGASDIAWLHRAATPTLSFQQPIYAPR